MLTNLQISGYKSLERCELALANLNVLVGANASGKSSVLQSLLLLRQSMNEADFINELSLAGPLYEAGTAQDILHPRAKYRVRFGLTTEASRYSYNFHVDRQLDNGLSLRRIPSARKQRLPDELSSRGFSFMYLNAERVGPRTSYGLSSGDKAMAGPLGKHGEFTPSVLARSQLDERRFDGWSDSLAKKWGILLELTDKLELYDDLTDSQGRVDLLSNVFLSWVIPGSHFECSELITQDLSTLSYRVGALRSTVRPTHIGFGLSYTLPIIASALSLDTRGVMIVENPEAHLHPYSQSRLGMFLAMIASTDRQVFIETHSDHIINGIRLAAKYSTIPAEKIHFNHFTYDNIHQKSSVQQIQVDQRGKVSSWPRGFFDQIESDLSKL